MKKLVAALLAAMMLLSLAACGGEPASNNPGGGGGGAANDGKTYEMMVGHAQPDDNPRNVSLLKFKEDVESKTNGKVKVTVLGNGQLGTEKEMLEQVVQGTVQGMRGGQFDFSPRLLMFTAPFMTQNRAQVTALLQSDLAKSVCAEMEKDTGTVIISLCDAGGYRQFSTNAHPITKPSDLQGLKMRTNGMKTIDMTFQAMGANTISVPYSDLYMGLKTGVADGQENPWVNVVGMKFYEVQKYFTAVNYQFHPDPFYVNADWWNGLPEEYQTIISECATDMANYNDQLIDESSDAAMQTIIDSGAEVYVPTAEELQAFVDAAQPVYEQMVSQGICTQAEMDQMWEIVNNAG